MILLGIILSSGSDFSELATCTKYSKCHQKRCFSQ